jgi:dTDP-4-dehydrorhamnose reductase
MKLLLLGSNGQLGTDILAAQGKSAGTEITALTRGQIDVSQPATVASALTGYEFDVLVNCTSYHKTDDVELNASLAFAINTHSVREMARACEARQARFMHVSTDYVFAGTAHKPYMELDCIGPVNVYGASKAMGEQLALQNCSRTLVLRVASLFGTAGASGKGGNFVETMIRLARANGEVKVVNDITMSPTATADVARWVLQLAVSQAASGIFHAVNSGGATWFEFAVEILRQAGIEAQATPISSDAFPTVAKRPDYSVLDNSRLAAVVGTLPTWQDALSRYLVAKGHVQTVALA